jgi:hypothetical protein
MRALLPQNYLFVAPLRDSASTVEVSQFTIAGPIEQPPVAPDCSKRTTEQRRLARLRCHESRPHDRSIESLYNTRETVIQIACGGPSLVALRTRATCGDADAHSNEVNLAPERPE